MNNQANTYYSLDNTNLKPTERFEFHLGNLAPCLAFAFLGTFLFSATYAIFIFFKDYYITNARKDEPLERGFYYRFVEYKAYIKNISIFSFIIGIFWVVCFFTPWRKYIIILGFILFSAGFLIHLINYYLISHNKFDLFDDYIWIYNKLKNRNINNSKIKDE